ncbi:MAG: 16S rRNA (adenine(1518)-N(6)/adenine(1519)-N(6))-dimethyltransferase RsmA [Alphaproteobacteria bacterium]|nr:16S rRNA (adenine(1518)-N(6)/adenine(1519)-N(6))-dimethyltransferase RsmA [Alphaproteobacteria bacterium]
MLLSLRDTVKFYGLAAEKSLGQNFLLDEEIVGSIVEKSLKTQSRKDFHDCNIIEVGPGPGGLTRMILKNSPKSLTVVEMDERCVRIMQDLKQETDCPFNIINGDALEFEEKNIAAPRQIISNLPYNISVPLLLKWLAKIAEFEALTLMFQKEVAERITAPRCCKDYGRVSVIAQLTCQIDELLDLSPQCFTPAPKVWSRVLLFRPLKNPVNAQEIAKISQITALAFGQRRKMLRQSLKSLPDIIAKLESLGIPPTARAEELTPQQFLELSRLY